MKPLKILIVDDSPIVCMILESLFVAERDIQVVGVAHSGEEALRKARTLRPSVITLDMDMPEVDGLSTLEWIMYACPAPTIMLSGMGLRSEERAKRCIELGAVDVVFKSDRSGSLDAEKFNRDLLSRVRVAAGIHVVRSSSRPGHLEAMIEPVRRLDEIDEVKSLTTARETRTVVVIGASTGGPTALRHLLHELSAGCAAAVLIVQHMPAGVIESFVSQLDRELSLKVKIATDREQLKTGRVFVVPGDRNVAFDAQRRIRLKPQAESETYRPSIDHSMRSAAARFGVSTIGVLMTGMGNDGVSGLVSIHNAGGYTMVQEPRTCVVDSMPLLAIKAGAVDRVGSPQEIGKDLADEISVRGCR